MMSRYYLLDKDNEPVPCSFEELGREFDNPNRTINKTDLDGVEISTVFLGIAHGHNNGKPILFETMVFGGHYDGYCLRCCSYNDSLQAHDATSAMVELYNDQVNKYE